ncbi:MAG: hypothetical protein K1W24_10435 [Lachnospiraceae bacterium]
MKSYDKVIFICTTNTFCSPVAEAVYKEIAPAWLPEAVSRGIVVLFSEPISPKVNVILSSHDIGVSNHKHSMQLKKEDITQDTLMLAMAFSEKVKLMEDFGLDSNVYTIGEFIGEDTDMVNPYGADDAQYKSFFEEVQKRVERVILRIEAIYHEEGGEDNDSIRQ